MNSEESLLEFPCRFPLKVMGRNSGSFETCIVAVVRRHVAPDEALEISSRLSSGGKYLALTIIFTALNKAQLDALYEEIHRQDGVLMTL